MKKESQWDVTRKVRLENINSVRNLVEIEKSLLSKNAIKAVHFFRALELIQITYDASKIDLSEIFTLLNTLKIKRKKSLWLDIKFSWYQYTDENRKDYATNKDVACCNKPPRLMR